ncbi:deleted in malignant brain tumors 1 protein-like [Dreissena polymorpha]|nr:deleted in malignant brain tumors 1 protein-like [Dreissena polymorpha]
MVYCNTEARHNTISAGVVGEPARYMVNICQDYFSNAEATVYCRTSYQPSWNVNYTTDDSSSGAYTDDSSYMLRLSCRGNEDDVSQCNVRKTNCSGNPYNGVNIVCSDTKIELINGRNNLHGTVRAQENGTWRYICSDGFGLNEARAVCVNVNGTAVAGKITRAYVGKNDMITNIRCHGMERDISMCTSMTIGYCNSGYAAVVDCNTVRLVGGNAGSSGRVEIYNTSTHVWSTVCSKRFDYSAANVICKQLGYLYSNNTYGTSLSGGKGAIQEYDLKCFGNEWNINNCISESYFTSSCNHNNDVDVNCGGIDSQTSSASYTQVRLVDGGRVEVYYEGQWGTVCATNFDSRDMKVICRMLGQIGSGRYYTGNPAREGNVMIEDLACLGNESHLDQCYSNAWLSNTCDHNEDISIDCNYYDSHTTHQTSQMPHSYTREPNDGDIRLANGGFDHGRLEVFYNNQWGSVCMRGFDYDDAKTVCRMLGLYQGDSYLAIYNAHNVHGWSYSDVLIEDLRCQGDEWNLAQCESRRPWTNTTCNSAVGVGCRNNYNTTAMPSVSSHHNQCGGYFFGNNGLIASPNYPNNYENRENCTYYINVPGGYSVCLQFNTFTTQECCDHLDIYDGPSTRNKRIARLSGDNPQLNGTEICASGNFLTAHFITDYSSTAQGFEAKYAFAPLNYYRDIIRLESGPDKSTGRVEIFHNGQWGTVCDDGFGYEEVLVVCRMLGLYRGHRYGRFYIDASGSGQIWLGDLRCHGHEFSLDQCCSNCWGMHNCTHEDDVGVDCQYYRGDNVSGSTSQSSRETTTFPHSMTTDTGGYTVQDAIRVACSETGWDIQVDKSILRHLYPSARASDIYLGENICVGFESWNRVVFQQGLRECLTSETIRHDVLVYSNELVYAERDPIHSFIIRHYNWTVGVECDVQRNGSSSGHVRNENNNNPGGQLVTGASNYSVNMAFYLDPNFQQPIPSNPLRVPVGTDVYVKVFTQATDWTVKMRVHTCYTKPSPTSPDNLRYNLIQNGCEVDANTHLISQSTHETRFVFKDFEYTSDHQGIHVMCDATFCSTSDYSRQCTQTCNPTIRRNVNVKRGDDVTKSSYDFTAEGVTGSDKKTTEDKAGGIQ